MERAIRDSKIKTTDVTYVNAHATSTPIGDTIEVKAIKSLFGDFCKNIAVSSTKGAHGHLLGIYIFTFFFYNHHIMTNFCYLILSRKCLLV